MLPRILTQQLLNQASNSVLHWIYGCIRARQQLLTLLQSVSSKLLWCTTEYCCDWTHEPHDREPTLFTEKARIPFPFTLNGIWSWWQFSFRSKKSKKTVSTIISHSMWKEMEYELSQCSPPGQLYANVERGQHYSNPIKDRCFCLEEVRLELLVFHHQL